MPPLVKSPKSSSSFVQLLERRRFGQRVCRSLRFQKAADRYSIREAMCNIPYDCAKSEPFSHRAVESCPLIRCFESFSVEFFSFFFSF